MVPSTYVVESILSIVFSLFYLVSPILQPLASIVMMFGLPLFIACVAWKRSFIWRLLFLIVPIAHIIAYNVISPNDYRSVCTVFTIIPVFNLLVTSVLSIRLFVTCRSSQWKITNGMFGLTFLLLFLPLIPLEAESGLAFQTNFLLHWHGEPIDFVETVRYEKMMYGSLPSWAIAELVIHRFVYPVNANLVFVSFSIAVVFACISYRAQYACSSRKDISKID